MAHLPTRSAADLRLPTRRCLAADGDQSDFVVVVAAGAGAAAGVEVVDVALDEAVLELSLDEELDEDSELAEVLAPPSLLADEYRSEYQPPPFKMKPPPREIWRLARGSPHLGQSLRG